MKLPLFRALLNLLINPQPLIPPPLNQCLPCLNKGVLRARHLCIGAYPPHLPQVAYSRFRGRGAGSEVSCYASGVAVTPPVGHAVPAASPVGPPFPIHCAPIGTSQPFCPDLLFNNVSPPLHLTPPAPSLAARKPALKHTHGAMVGRSRGGGCSRRPIFN